MDGDIFTDQMPDLTDQYSRTAENSGRFPLPPSRPSPQTRPAQRSGKREQGNDAQTPSRRISSEPFETPPDRKSPHCSMAAQRRSAGSSYTETAHEQSILPPQIAAVGG
jgi:hypothetical protein